MAIRLYIEKVGPEESSELEVKVNTETRMMKIGNEKVHIGKYLFISSPEYREGKYPTICIRYETGETGIKNREETIKVVKDMRCIKAREDQQVPIRGLMNSEMTYFLDIIFPIMTRLAVANYDLD